MSSADENHNRSEWKSSSAYLLRYAFMILLVSSGQPI